AGELLREVIESDDPAVRVEHEHDGRGGGDQPLGEVALPPKFLLRALPFTDVAVDDDRPLDPFFLADRARVDAQPATGPPPLRPEEQLLIDDLLARQRAGEGEPAVRIGGIAVPTGRPELLGPLIGGGPDPHRSDPTLGGWVGG